MYDIVCDAISVVNVKTNKYLVYSHSNYRPTSHVVQQTIKIIIIVKVKTNKFTLSLYLC